MVFRYAVVCCINALISLFLIFSLYIYKYIYNLLFFIFEVKKKTVTIIYQSGALEEHDGKVSITICGLPMT